MNDSMKGLHMMVDGFMFLYRFLYCRRSCYSCSLSVVKTFLVTKGVSLFLEVVGTITIS
jgi:hypothetical protein